MGTHRLLILAAVLSAGVSAPALAAWDRIGSVDLAYGTDRATQYGNFGGSVERLSLRAQDSNVMCRDVRATFGNGQTTEIFHGNLPMGQDVTVDLPGDQRLVRRIAFTCHADSPRGAKVQISADIGRYQNEWRSSADWGRVWSRTFSWANDNRPNIDRWVPLGSERFAGRFDHQTTVPGTRGQNVDMIGLKPVDSDARCSRVVATYRDGRTSALNVNAGGLLSQDHLYRIDLPGNNRDVTRIDFNCHPERSRAVTIQVFANK